MPEKLKIRPANLSDAKNIFDLSNDKVVRANSINQNKIEWNSHIEWFTKSIKDENCVYYVAEYEKEFCGQIRFNKKNDEWITSISVKDGFRGMGTGEKILKLSVELMVDKSIIAYVKNENEASLKMFSACKFLVVAEECIDNKNYKILKYVK